MTVHHESPFSERYKSNIPFVLLPYGYSVNRGLKDEKEIEFLNGDKAEIKAVCAVDLTKQIARTLCLMRYNRELDDVFIAWVNKAVVMGNKKDSVSKEKCLLVYHGSVNLRK